MPLAVADESLDHHRGQLRARADQAARRAAIAEAAGDHPRAAQERLQENEYRRAADAADRRLRRNAAQRTAVLTATLTHQGRSGGRQPVHPLGAAMIEDHIDPTGEAHTHISNLLRTAVTAAAAMADQRAQRHQRQLQDMERRSEAERRTFTDRINAERQTAELVYRRAYQDSWWEKARPEDIAAAVVAAGAWAGADPKAADALRHIGGQLHDRHRVDLDELYRAAQDPAAVPEQVHATLTRDTSPRQAGDGPPWHAEVLAAAGETTGRGILESQGWPELAERLDALHVSGEDVAGWLQRAVAQRELGTANDKSLALLWRLKPAQDTTARSTGADVARVAAAAAGAGAPRPGRDRPGRPAGSFVARQLPNSARRQQQARSGRENGTEAAAG